MSLKPASVFGCLFAGQALLCFRAGEWIHTAG